MGFVSQFKEDIFKTDKSNFEDKALDLFQYQASENKVYKEYLDHLKVDRSKVASVIDIPFMPIDFFKTHQVISGNVKSKVIFESSGTTGQIRSKHYVADLEFYNQVSEYIFEQFYGKLSDYTFFALLPSYTERDNSSLIYMVNHFISKSKSKNSGFYLSNLDELVREIQNSKLKTPNLILIGVTFALLDLAEKEDVNLSNAEIIETGGMKGRRKEMIREEVHEILTKRLSIPYIGSEYGMTELLSQGYARKEGIFLTPDWLKIILRNVNDPFEKNVHINRGGVNVIDLANIDSCAFIETKDLGQMHSDGTFSILGRFDNSDVRGCNLMIA